MKLNDFPTELLSEIFGHLQDDYSTLGKARLVCRQWNALARRHMYQTVSLQDYIAKSELFDDQGQELAVPDHHGFRLWTALAQNEVVRQTAKAVKVHSGPSIRSGHLILSDGFCKIWNGWEQCEWKQFQDAIAQVADLPALNHVHILFPAECDGLNSAEDEISGSLDIPEPWIQQGTFPRFYMLRDVFKVIAERKARHSGKASVIQALSIENLANQPFSELLLPGLPFDSLVKDITQLRLHITHEDGEYQDEAMDLIERQVFEPFLQEEFLPHFSDQLTCLHLSFRAGWGVAPGNFDGRGLVFPNLKTLTLGSFEIVHHDHFDWVLAQTSLENLILHNCVIITYLHLGDEHIEKWCVSTEDWFEFPDEAWGFREGSAWMFDETWEELFDRIRGNLSSLVDFRFTFGGCCSRVFDTPGFTDKLSPRRYGMLRAFPTYDDDGSTPDGWRDLDFVCYVDAAGNMEFGNNVPNYSYSGDPEQEEYEFNLDLPRLNRAEDTEQGDFRAFEELLKAAQERSERKQCSRF